MIERVFAMPNSQTFKIKPIETFVMGYLKSSAVSVDCFARNNLLAEIRNDIDHGTLAHYHLDVREFLQEIERSGIEPDLIIFDPPYSSRQAKECYSRIGFRLKTSDCQRINRWTQEKALIKKILAPGGVFLQFGWSTTGISRWTIEKILLVNHGAGHYDTICLAQRKPFNS